jgi:ABC-type uncharacterized transport system substrate-binding protein
VADTGRGAASTTLVVGFLRSTSLSPFENLVSAFQRGLNEAGFIEGQNVTIAYRYGDDQIDRIQMLIAELIRQPVAVIVANNASALVAVSKTTTVPIVFVTGGDPVSDGLVANINRPGGNITGVVFFSSFLGPKRLELLRELAPPATIIAVLASPALPNTEAELRAVEQAAEAIGQQLVVYGLITTAISRVHLTFSNNARQARCLSVPVRFLIQDGNVWWR